jgi:integrase/recombinase XerD
MASASTHPKPGPRRRGRAPVPLPVRLEAIHAGYLTALAKVPLSAETRRTYASKVRGYLAWLADTDFDGDPLADADARDWAVRDYRTHLAAVLKRSSATINNALAAIDDFYTRTGLGPAAADRLDLPTLAPHALEDDQTILRWLRAVRATPSARDRALVLTPFYAGARITEAVRLDLDDITRSARKGTIRFYGKGGRPRDMELHPQLREAYADWIDRERPGWPGADHNPAVFLNHRGGRLTARGASDVFTAILDRAGLNDHATAHVLRHTFATRLVRGGTDLVVVADMLGHTSLDQIRRYTQPTTTDRRDALKHLPVDR